MQMRITPDIPPELTPPVVYLRGKFSLWKFVIPYFSSVIPLGFARDKFALIEDIPDEERIEWSLEELFQREVSWERVKNELVPYLRSENQPQFFNALTIALLPRYGHGFAARYEEKVTYESIADPALDAPLQIGGIQIQPYKGSGGGAGKLRWDVKEIMPVAVDGQHRLAAIKEFGKRVASEKLDSSFVPIIFLVPDKRAGFVEPPLPESAATTVSTLRRIFIDLNKNARPVTRARNILLDDQDIVSVCTRSLVGQRLTDKEEANRIPLPVVDWISERNKFDTGPFVTTILLLHEIVGRVLDMPKFDGFDIDDPKIPEWLARKFDPNDQQLQDLVSQIQRCINQEVPITFMPTEIELLRELFERRWRPLLNRLFSELKPYRELREYGRKTGLHRPEFVNLYIAHEILEGDHAQERATHIEGAVKEHDPDWNKEKHFRAPLAHIDKNIKKDHWAFKVVFQKALFTSYLRLLEQAPTFVSENNAETERQKFTSMWIEAVNSLFDTHLALHTATFSRPKEGFWGGIGLKQDDTIDFTVGGSNRLSSWLTIWVCLYWLNGDSPSFAKLEKDDRQIVGLIHRSLDPKQIRRGMEQLARAKMEGEYEPDELERESRILMSKRYEYMARVARKQKSSTATS